MSKISYPTVRRDDTISDCFFEKHTVEDPYRWLEDPDSEETQAFVAAQNETTQSVFSTNKASREKIQERMTELYNYEKTSCPRKRGSRYFYYKNDGLQNQDVLYMKDDDADNVSIVLDPNTLSTDGTVSLSSASLSEGKVDPNTLYFAYGLSSGGSDWQSIRVKNVLTNDLLTQDVIHWVKFSSISWMQDDSGFFYARFPTPPEFVGKDPATCAAVGTETNANVNHQIWFHRLGTSQADDKLVFAYPDEPHYYLGAEVSEDGQYLLLYMRDGCKNACMVSIAPLNSEEFKAWSSSTTSTDLVPGVTPLVSNMDASYDYLLNIGTTFYFQTNLDAKRERVVKTDISTKANEDTNSQWIEVIPEPTGQIVLESAVPVAHHFVIIKTLEDVQNKLALYNIETGEKVVDEIPILEGIGTISVSAQASETEFFFKFTSFLTPGTIYKATVRNNSVSTPSVYYKTVIANFDASLYETRQVFYKSKDGTSIPMFIVSKKDLPLTGMNPTYLYGYGGFNIAIKPAFSTFRLVFIQHFNGIIAMPSLRGGSEYGEGWHEAGTLSQKQNVFDDFIAAAEYLVAEEYTINSKIAIHGGSNGGLLVAACANQRPDLFAAAVASVGVLDMLRFHKFTCGRGWCTDYGNPDNESDFEYIYKYSPLHNVPSSTDVFPALLLTTGDHDDRVVPLHSFKYISQVQHAIGKNVTSPLLIRIETKAGHGAGKPTSKIIEEYADVYAFIASSLDATYEE